MSTELDNFITVKVAEQATGCRGAGGYIGFAHANGYPYVEALDMTSSAGDWAFLISKDGYTWRLMWQVNNWPRRGFSYEVDTAMAFYGTAEEALQQAYEYSLQ